MRIVFAGTPVFAVAALDALHAAGHDIAGVYTQPDRPAGRGRVLTASPVAQRAAALGLPVFRPESFKRQPEAVAALRGLAPEALVVVAYGLILPPEVLEIPPRGCWNIHASLLPRWRGAAPIQRAVLAGDAETGVTIMRMEAGLDTGPMLLAERLAIGLSNAGELHDALAPMGARLMVQALALLHAGAPPETPQPAEGVTYAAKLDKNEARLNWQQPAEALARAVRAYHPVPGAWCERGGERLRIHAATALPGKDLPPGECRDDRVGTGAGCLRLDAVQWPGGTALRGAALRQKLAVCRDPFALCS